MLLGLSTLNIWLKDVTSEKKEKKISPSPIKYLICVSYERCLFTFFKCVSFYHYVNAVLTREVNRKISI